MPNVSLCAQENEVHYNPLPYQGFCKLTLNDGSVVELEGSGELTSTMTSEYKSTVINAEIGTLCTSIGNSAFEWWGSVLSSVTIPDSVTSIGHNAFSHCTNLPNITIPNSVISIDYYAFVDCSGLTSVAMGSGVTSISNYAFESCSGLTSIVSLATTAPTIQNDTFKNVKTNGTLTVPSGSSGYDVWMGTGDYYLGKYGWTKVEQ